MLFWARPLVTGIAHPTIAQTREALRKGDYGRCVFRCDNNVNERQGTLLRFADDITANFQVNAMTRSFCRRIQIFGTKGELSGQDSLFHIRVREFGKGSRSYRILPKVTGHLGADTGICETLHRLMLGQQVDESRLTTLDVTAQSHKLVYAALRSQQEQQTVLLP